MLGRDHDRVEPHRLVAVIFHRHLTLAVGAQPVDFTLLARFGQPLQNAMRHPDRQRHQFGSVVAGEAEHQALVPRADVFPGRVVGVDAHRDIGALFVDREEHRARVRTNTPFVIGVPDILDDVPGHLRVLDTGRSGDLARNQHESGRDKRFAGDATVGILSEDRVQHAVGDLVGQLVRMAHTDRFAGEQISACCHCHISLCCSESLVEFHDPAWARLRPGTDSKRAL
jgi:hypothetical protein